MNFGIFLSLLSFAFIASITPGPNNFLMMSSGALFGWRRSIPHLCGIVFGMAVLTSASVLGLGALIEQYPSLLTVVRLLGSGWLVWLATRFFKSAATTNKSSEAELKSLSRPFRFYEAAAFQWINPKAILTSVSSVSAFIAVADSLWLRIASFASVFMLAAAVSCTLWMLGGNVLNHHLATGKHARWLNIGMGLLILGTAVYLLLP